LKDTPPPPSRDNVYIFTGLYRTLFMCLSNGAVRVSDYVPPNGLNDSAEDAQGRGRDVTCYTSTPSFTLHNSYGADPCAADSPSFSAEKPPLHRLTLFLPRLLSCSYRFRLLNYPISFRPDSRHLGT
jgi:hypothetical protein